MGVTSVVELLVGGNVWLRKHQSKRAVGMAIEGGLTGELSGKMTYLFSFLSIAYYGIER